MKNVFLPLTMAGLLLMSTPGMADEPAAVRICDSQGCSDRPRDAATFQPGADDPVAELRAAALTELAKNDPRAAWDLGLRYFRGDGVRKDTYQALHWMRDAGERGIVPAQLAVGRFYLMGLEEMGSDPAEAVTWLSMAASKGNKEAKKLLKEAQSAERSEQKQYQVREEERKSWSGYWSSGYAYYTTWGPQGWYYR
ncbi:tetratricopeptide repeat protein [Hydrogenophaga sp. PAMC20947]|uniref:tetratricopeptide repeat protein n=1 Tax=Hydrogenophaga sp. PAMC20947 TaxID=2565558 RepID=UPI00109E296D|nr:tetratricopeptide repeat protein [Hydrogenophaga sp. PAMC20947]QCB48783.1 sel1 repeat family protein [Hydrogenophaga sp. PAMC20947]